MPYHWDLTPDSPVRWVKELLQQPPGPFPDGWFGHANIAQALRELMQEPVDRVPEPPAWQHDRGIVICGGGWQILSVPVCPPFLLVNRLPLPIQVRFLGDPLRVPSGTTA